VTREYRVYACGSNASGSLGLGRDIGSVSTPTLVPLANVIQVAAGGFYTLFLTSSLQLYTSGGRGCGGSELSDWTPQFMSKDVTSIYAADHVFIRKANGDLFVCGDNRFGQLGLGHNGAQWSPISFPMRNVSKVRLGKHHSFIVTASNQILAFGSNRYGHLGFVDNTDRHVPTKINIYNTSEIYSGYGCSFAMTTPCDNCFDFCFGLNMTDPHVCSGRGSCIEENVCRCHENYASFNCHIPICQGRWADDPQVCSGRGTCVLANNCACIDRNFTSPVCAECRNGLFGNNCQYIEMYTVWICVGTHFCLIAFGLSIMLSILYVDIRYTSVRFWRIFWMMQGQSPPISSREKKNPLQQALQLETTALLFSNRDGNIHSHIQE
jgi:hypothetical protein